jgi:hypothetical protein
VDQAHPIDFGVIEDVLDRFGVALLRVAPPRPGPFGPGRRNRHAFRRSQQLPSDAQERVLQGGPLSQVQPSEHAAGAAHEINPRTVTVTDVACVPHVLSYWSQHAPL